MPTFKVTNKQLQDPQFVREFVVILGSDTYRQIIDKIAFAVGGNGKLGGLTEAEIDKLSPEEYAKKRDAILQDMEKLKPADSEIEIEFSASYGAAGNIHDQWHAKRFGELFGHEAFMKLYGLEGYETADPKVIERLNPHAATYKQYVTSDED